MWFFTLLNILINEKNTVAGSPFDFDVFNRIHSIITSNKIIEKNKSYLNKLMTS
jgi:hypothetical protein